MKKQLLVLMSIGLFGIFEAKAEFSQGTTQSLGDQKYDGRGQPYAPGSLDYNQTTVKFDTKDAHKVISGRCVIQNPAGLEIPCTRAQVILLDHKGKKFSTTDLTEGGFSFRVEEEKSYFIEVSATGYEMSPSRLGPFKGGDKALVKLVKKKK